MKMETKTSEQGSTTYKMLFISLAVVVAAVEILSALDLRNRPYTGFAADDNSVITSVAPDSPAEKAGIQPGDRMTMNSGIEAKNFKELLRLPRANVGETRRYVFERDGKPMNVDLTFEKLPPKEIAVSFSFAALGVCFLGLGLWAYFKVGNTFAALLALVCFSAAIDFVSHPYISSYDIRLIYMSILNIIVFFGYAFLFHLLVVFPKPKKIVSKKYGTIVIYGPAILMTVVLLSLAIIQPERSSWLFVSATLLYALFFVSYLGMTVVALIRSYAKATGEERSAYGLKFILFGAIVGLAPSIISGIVRLLSPTLVLPGADFYIFPAVLIPLSLALAITRSNQHLQRQSHPTTTGGVETGETLKGTPAMS